MKAQSPYPAQLKVFLESGTKTFTTPKEEAAPMLRDMGIDVEEDKTETLQKEMAQGSWTNFQDRKAGRNSHTPQRWTYKTSSELFSWVLW